MSRRNRCGDKTCPECWRTWWDMADDYKDGWWVVMALIGHAAAWLSKRKERR